MTAPKVHFPTRRREPVLPPPRKWGSESSSLQALQIFLTLLILAALFWVLRS